MYKEIGSNFWLDRYERMEQYSLSMDYLNLNYSDISYLSTGRSAISFVLNHIQKPEGKEIALLPPFTCHTVIEPFIRAGYQIQYYRIDKHLMLTHESLLEDIAKYKPSVVLVHSYFGFNTLESIRNDISEIRKLGITIIEDITQSLYSRYKHINADYYICSFRKWTALPDGGCAISMDSPFAHKLGSTDEKLQEAKLKAFYAKHLYMNKNQGIKSEFLRMFQEAEEMLEQQEIIYGMASTSKILQANLDIDNLRIKRRKNYQILANGLTNNDILEPLFMSLTEEATPLYFPVYVKCNRKELQEYLADQRIYAPVVWPKPIQCENIVCEDVNWIYDHILSIPCDQRYDAKEMNYIIDTINCYLDEE